MRKPLLLILSAGCLISCHKDNAVPANNWTWFGTQNKAVYNYVLINANQVLTNTESDELHVGVSAAFIDSNNNQITVVRALTVNNQVIMPGSDSTYNFSYGSDQSANAGSSRLTFRLLPIKLSSTIKTLPRHPIRRSSSSSASVCSLLFVRGTRP